MKRVSRILSSILAFVLCISMCAPAFAIVNIENATVEIANEGNINYTSNEITPELTVTVGGTTLTKNVDYTLQYSDNTNAGTASAVITGMGNYEGTKTVTFDIAAANISAAVSNGSIKVVKNKTYAGQTPSVALTSTEFSNLTKGVDYTVTATNYSKVGINSANITITGLGNYTGTVSSKMTVYPKKVTGVKTTARDSSSFTISWTSQKDLGVTGYKVYTCDSTGKLVKCIATTSSTSYKVKRTDSTVLDYAVKAYYKSGSTTITSLTYNVLKNCAKPAKVAQTSLSNSGKTTIVSKWKRVKSSGYEIQYATKSNFSNAKTVVVKDSKNLSKKITVKNNDTKYYTRVRAYRNVNGNKVYGSWSNVCNNKFSILYMTYKSHYVSNKNRTTNLRIASKAITGTILQPGQTFSFNKVVGERTTGKGYKAAHVFTGPHSMTMGTGGGVCQVASTIFNSVLLANLQVVERHQHSQRVTYVPLGRDAAVYWKSKDFKFKNNTNQALKMVMQVKDGYISCSFYTCSDAKPKKVSLKVSRSGSRFTLRRYVNGKVNYTTKSNY